MIYDFMMIYVFLRMIMMIYVFFKDDYDGLWLLLNIYDYCHDYDLGEWSTHGVSRAWASLNSAELKKASCQQLDVENPPLVGPFPSETMNFPHLCERLA